ncbi:hypothetical protein A2Z67_00175 [Candidatus Woesebacteria bacterium RBG_13_36_22]|uniref:Calcineurin-like phosphoesterase domain-containing protein n=1 Tax=Candidatus Woesebacteria bacterium RBG_13_36_22 TaxID=1802478 RepID=A0A1F7X343_9BACT|nr:MAG: hypothetical protein A2Z67_00175 [Candidatus Woesebacteria bacterium RBG_13_36_22]
MKVKNKVEEKKVVDAAKDSEIKQERIENDRKLIMSKRYVRAIGCISDMHVGSYYSIFPEGFTIKPGIGIQLNEGQKELLSYFWAFKQVCDDLNVDTFFVAGDMLHGQNRKEVGINLISTDLNIQKRAAEELLKPILKGRKSYWVSGSGYHASTPGHNPDEGLCESLGKEPDTYTQWLGTVANLKIGKRIFNLSHGGSGAFIYRETAMAREIVFSKVAFANGKLPKIDMFIHGHFHWFCYLHEQDAHFLQLPCWMAYEPITLYTKNYTRFQPDIGGAIILIDEEERILVWHFMYPLPHIADETREI